MNLNFFFFDDVVTISVMEFPSLFFFKTCFNEKCILLSPIYTSYFLHFMQFSF